MYRLMKNGNEMPSSPSNWGTKARIVNKNIFVKKVRP